MQPPTPTISMLTSSHLTILAVAISPVCRKCSYCLTCTWKRNPNKKKLGVLIPSPVTINNFPDILTGILYYVQFLAYIIAVSGLITYVCVYLIINLLLNLRSTKDIKWKILLIIMISYRPINSLYNNHDNVSKFCVLGGGGLLSRRITLTHGLGRGRRVVSEMM